MAATSDVLDLFSRPVRDWFREAVGTPTEIQRLAWPRIAAGEHALVTAPTGSGKTLTAFLWALDRLLSGTWEGGVVRVLYVSPLRALGTDVRRNLLQPLEAIPLAARRLGLDPPAVRVATRTGDTSEADRRRMLRAPPEILVTTPETLNILLTSRRGRRLLEGVRSVILDEIHAVVGSKRGVHLMTAVERLVPLAGEVQRVALSATVRPLDVVAAWIGGHRLEGGPVDPRITVRPVRVVEAASRKPYELTVDLPVEAGEVEREGDDFWTRFSARLRPSIRRNRSTLLFGNSRRTVEKVARFLNEGERTQLAYAHHGALSREIREVVEERLKAGSLPAIVATSSLELGIDIGSIDEVVMVQTPPTVTSATQRLGRAGHDVGSTSRGRIVPLHVLGLLEAAAVCRAVLDGELEETKPIRGALDVLAQVLLSMIVERTRTLDELYAEVRRADCYRHLPRRHFDLVVDMLAGRYATSRIRALRPLISVDLVDGVVRPRPGAERLLYLAGGTIPDRGYFQLRLVGSGAALGQLDEEFVWERSVGDSFTLGVQSWRIEQITHNDVLVSPTSAHAAMAPFWRAEERDRSFFLSDRVGRLLETLEPELARPDLASRLSASHHLTAAAAAELVRLLRDQRAVTGALPHRHRIVVEHTRAPSGQGAGRRVVIHTLWGGVVNRPLAYAMAAALEEELGSRADVIHGDDCVVVSTAVDDRRLDDPLSLVPPDRLDDLLRARLEETGFFGARFREAAGCALVLPRSGPTRRTPLWLHRQRAKEILDAVSGHGDFPLVLEAWRSCLQDAFALDTLRILLADVAAGRIEARHVVTERPSPMAGQVLWRQTNRLMYEDDRPDGAPRRRLDEGLVREIALSSSLRPRLSPRLVSELEAKLQRTADGYAPRGPAEVLAWLEERVALPQTQWDELVAAVARDHETAAHDLRAALAGKIVSVSPGEVPVIVACGVVPRLEIALGRELELLGPAPVGPPAAGPGELPEPRGAVTAARRRHRRRSTEDATGHHLSSLVGEWLRFHGPVEIERLAGVFGLDGHRLGEVLDDLVESEEVVVDELTEGATEVQICDRENLERLLRMARVRRARPLPTRPASDLPLFLAEHHGLGLRDAGPADLDAAIKRLVGWVAPAAQWETELLPARVEPYHPEWLDATLAQSELVWVGHGDVRLTLLPDDGRDLLGAPHSGSASARLAEELDAVFPHPLGRFTLDELVLHSQRSSADVVGLLWRAAWAGAASTDTFAPVRRGISTGFGPSPDEPITATPLAGSRRSRFSRWQSRRPFSGSWFRLQPPIPAADALAEEERERDRARLLLERHGVVFRDLLAREAPALRWGRVFRSMRMLELAGEVVSGRFFDGVRGLQFASPAAVRRLTDGLHDDRVWWLGATDPASTCGLGVAGLEDLPARRSGTLVCFHGTTLVLVVRRGGRRLDVSVPPDHPRLSEYLEPLRALLLGSADPRRHLSVDVINRQPATSSPYRAGLGNVFHVTRGPRGLRLSRRY